MSRAPAPLAPARIARPWPIVWVSLPGGIAHAAERLGEPLPDWHPCSICGRPSRPAVKLDRASGYAPNAHAPRCRDCTRLVTRRDVALAASAGPTGAPDLAAVTLRLERDEARRIARLLAEACRARRRPPRSCIRAALAYPVAS